jgi:hypothetical protein
VATDTLIRSRHVVHTVTRLIAGCFRFFTLIQCVRYFQDRTFVNASRKSASGHEETHAPQQTASLDHLVGATEQ